MSKKYNKIHVNVPFTTTGPEIQYLPLKIAEDASIFAFLCQKKRAINPGTYTTIPTGILLNTPEIVETTMEGDTPSKYSKLSLHITIHPSPYLVESKGIVVVAPTVLPASHRSEIILIVRNIDKNVQTIHPGDEIALLSFTMVPRILLRYIPPNLNDTKGTAYVL